MISFYRSSNNFDDILTDPLLKRSIRMKLLCANYLFIKIDYKDREKMMSYITIKYGESMINFNHIAKDRTPVINKDYMPEPRKRVVH